MKIKGQTHGRYVDLDIKLTGKEIKEIKRFLLILTRQYSSNISEGVRNEIAEIMENDNENT